MEAIKNLDPQVGSLLSKFRSLNEILVTRSGDYFVGSSSVILNVRYLPSNKQTPSNEGLTPS